ncbi:MAG: T9SS type B sorting domain-containing protein [Bacteroidetes bacterium]|nr:MAG: T9SS type B sorting domain-containing protein [Bacteroidota bacterium]
MRSTFTVLLLILFSKVATAQLPPPCGIQNPPMAKTCATACILCDLDGYSSMTTQTIIGQVIPDYCTFIVHSMGYIGFVAGSTDLSIQVDVGNCSLGNSIEMGIYQTDDCMEFELVGDCNTAMFTNQSYVLSNTVPLVPGCPYFLVTDNNGPASCEFTVTVIAGSATAPTVTAPSVPSGPTSVCPGTTVEYTIPPVYGACNYRWTAPAGTLINGSPSPAILNHEEGTTVTVTWGSSGGQLCVSGSNPCSQGPPACLPVTVSPIPPTLLPVVRICNGDVFEWIDGNLYSSTQFLSTTYITDIGCDSLVQQQLIVDPPIIANIGTIRVCEGDCVTVGNGEYCSSGFYQETITAYNGCDSTIFFSILMVETEAVIAAADTLSCLMDTVLLDGSGSSMGSSFIWQDSSGMVLSNQDSLWVDEAGLYFLIVERDAAGITCRDTAQITVSANLNYPDLQAFGDSLSCSDPQGIISAVSNTPDVVYAWTGPSGFQSSQPDTTVSQPGLYYIAVTAPNGCIEMDSVEVFSDADPPQVTASAGDTLTCTIINTDLMAQSDIPGTQFSWSGPSGFTSNLPNPQVTIPGQYTVTGTAPNGCLDSVMVIVTADTTAPVISTSGDTISCAIPDVQLTVQVSPGSAMLEWSGPQNFSSNQPDPTVTVPGNYTVQATAVNGCTSTATALVAADTTAPLLTATGGTVSCALDSLDLQSTVQPSNSTITWAGPQGFTSNIPNPVVTLSGIYTATATAGNGCTSTTSATVLADTLPPQLTATGGTITCTQSTVTLGLNLTPTASTVIWTGPFNFTSNQPSPTVSEAGLYTVVATAPNGCTNSAETTVIADASIPQVSVTGGTITCAQPDITLSSMVSPAGSTLSWTGPLGFQSSQPAPTVNDPGIYTLLVTTANGCSATATAEVLADTISPVVTLTGGTISCTQPTISLSAVLVPASAGIVWSGPSGFTATIPDPSTSFAGMYTAVASLPNGCTASASTSVQADTVAPQLMTNGGTITCSQPTISLLTNVTPANSTVSWTGPQNFSSTQLNPTTSDAGVYTVTATAPNGCTNISTVNVLTDTLPPQISTTGGTLTCSQPQITLQTTLLPGNATLLWSGPQNFTSSDLEPAVSLDGQYTVLATAPNGCTATTTALVLIDTVAPVVSASGGLLTCVQNTLMLGASVTPANSTVLWSGPQGFTSMQLQPAVSVSGDYQIVATAPNGCTAAATATVTADSDFPVVVVGGGTLTCAQAAITLSSMVTPAGTAISWTGPQNFSSNQPSPNVTVPGNYVLTATTSAGCTATSTALVQIDTVAPQVAVTGTVLSCAQPSGTIESTISPAQSTLQWQGPSNFTSSNLMPTITLPGLYTVTVTAPNGCTSTTDTEVAADTVPPTVSATGGLLNCSQPTISLQLNLSPANSTIIWAGPQSFSSTEPNPVVNTAGTYTITATASNGCSSTATAVVNADVDLPTVNASGGTITCTSPSLTLSASATPTGGTFAWAGPQNFSSGILQPVVSVPGVYTLTVTLPNGCTASASATINTDLVPPTVDAFGNPITCLNDTAFLEAIVQPASSTLLWSGPQNFSSTLSTPAVALPGNYTVIATAANGCTASAQITIAALNQPTWSLSLGPDIEVEEFEPIFPHPVTDLPIDDWYQVDWDFPAFALGDPCQTCKLPVLKLPRSGTVTVHLTDPNGCTQSATYNILVQQTSAIYVPNIFTPEGNPENQIFQIYIGAEARVTQVTSFRIFDRWGEMVHERLLFQANEAGHGWDGQVHGKQALPGVYVWYAEIEFANGRKKLLKGDVTLYR